LWFHSKRQSGNYITKEKGKGINYNNYIILLLLEDVYLYILVRTTYKSRQTDNNREYNIVTDDNTMKTT